LKEKSQKNESSDILSQLTDKSQKNVNSDILPQMTETSQKNYKSDGLSQLTDKSQKKRQFRHFVTNDIKVNDNLFSDIFLTFLLEFYLRAFESFLGI
jgi:hypothetical protein